MPTSNIYTVYIYIYIYMCIYISVKNIEIIHTFPSATWWLEEDLRLLCMEGQCLSSRGLSQCHWTSGFVQGLKKSTMPSQWWTKPPVQTLLCQIGSINGTIWCIPNHILLPHTKSYRKGDWLPVLHTFSLGLYGDNLTGIPTAGRSDRHDPNAVLPVLIQVGQTSEINIRCSLKLTDHL